MTNNIPFPVLVSVDSDADKQSPQEAFGNLLRQQFPFEEASGPAQGSRRRKLWDLLPKFHCPVIGVCFEVGELRAMISRAMHFPRDTTDFVLHTTAVGACEKRTRLAELLHKKLEERFSMQVRKFSAARNAEGLRALWRQSSVAGTDIPGALWASWTHPACDPLLAQEIYGDIHMIQHQIGSGSRADLASLKAVKAENAVLRQQLQAVGLERDAHNAEKLREMQRRDQCIAELRADLAGKEGLVAKLTGQLDTLRESLPELKARQSLARRASDAEGRAMALRAKAAELEDEVERLRRVTRHAEETIEQLLAADDSVADGPQAGSTQFQRNLSGKRILCVGGRSGSVDAYRKMVEQRGGSFVHHDGGLEESLHRIDAALAAADLIICQAGCISHNAYWRVKEQCKRTGKQCVFIKNAGVTSFGRVVGVACTPSEETTIDRMPEDAE